MIGRVTSMFRRLSPMGLRRIRDGPPTDVGVDRAVHSSANGPRPTTLLDCLRVCIELRRVLLRGVGVDGGFLVMLRRAHVVRPGPGRSRGTSRQAEYRNHQGRSNHVLSFLSHACACQAAADRRSPEISLEYWRQPASTMPNRLRTNSTSAVRGGARSQTTPVLTDTRDNERLQRVTKITLRVTEMTAWVTSAGMAVVAPSYRGRPGAASILLVLRGLERHR